MIVGRLPSIFITTNLPKAHQATAGALINSLLFLGVSFFLGLADLLVARHRDLRLAGGYKVAFWFGVGLSGLAFVVFALIRVGSAKSDLTLDERREMERESARVEADGREQGMEVKEEGQSSVAGEALAVDSEQRRIGDEGRV